VSEFLIRCSALGRLMAKPENADLDPDYVTPEVAAIIAKTKRTDAEKALLDAVRRKSLSAGGRTCVRELLREDIYGYQPSQLLTKPVLKGQAVEEPLCLPMLARLTGRPLVKNTERRNNGLISGECDVFDAPIRHGRDIKAPYSMETMPIVVADAYDSGYEWQMRGYMMLWDAESWSVDYLLVNTPEELIGPLESPAVHVVDHIPEAHRWTSWLVTRDRALEDLIADKVAAARKYWRQALNEFDRTHRLPGDDIPVVRRAPEPVAASAPVKTAGPVDIPETIF
jgi:hypothetical protein